MWHRLLATIPTDWDRVGRAIAGHGGEPVLVSQTRPTATGTPRVLGDVDASQGGEMPRAGRCVGQGRVGGRTADICGVRLVTVEIGSRPALVGRVDGTADARAGERRLGARCGRDVAIVCVPSTSAVRSLAETTARPTTIARGDSSRRHDRHAVSTVADV